MTEEKNKPGHVQSGVTGLDATSPFPVKTRKPLDPEGFSSLLPRLSASEDVVLSHAPIKIQVGYVWLSPSYQRMLEKKS